MIDAFRKFLIMLKIVHTKIKVLEKTVTTFTSLSTSEIVETVTKLNEKMSTLPSTSGE